MTTYVLRIQTIGSMLVHRPTYLRSFDFNADYGRGRAEFCYLPGEAKAFESTEAALEFWRTQSTVNPVRLDGKPNRPLTASTVSVEEQFPKGAAHG